MIYKKDTKMHPASATHPERSTLEAFRQRTLSPAAMLDLSDHLCACADCRAQLAAPPATVADFLGDDTTLHLAEDDIATAAANPAALPAALRTHLASCADCQDEVADARTFLPRLTLVPSHSTPATKKPHWALWTAAAAACLATAAILSHTLRPTPPAPTTQLVAELRDGGGPIGLTIQGNLTGTGNLSAADAALLTSTLANHHLPTPATATAPTTGTLRGTPSSADTFALHAPVSEVTLPTPSFKWQQLPAATSYRVSLYDDAFQLVAQSPNLTTTTWTLDRTLTPGQAYNWVVRASTPHGTVHSPRPPALDARFTVATTDTLARIAAAQHQPHPHLLLAAIYAASNMTDLAHAELTTLQQQNPNSALVQDLARSLPPSNP